MKEYLIHRRGERPDPEAPDDLEVITFHPDVFDAIYGQQVSCVIVAARTDAARAALTQVSLYETPSQDVTQLFPAKE